ncbi:U-box domain containing protein [Nitzschia inconspicua]|uniref:U-box domain containing protein n=1 Tax=Nitzschia inconspicua TaxID=303405 RepID=A0A9K3LA06_9STRA|nr:U-box domain containing protein [Nitzschia inconspicua]
MTSFSNPPNEFVCDLTKTLMQEPMRNKHGHHFERQAIEEWMAMGNNFCPVTGMPMNRSSLVLNKTLQWTIQRWAKQNNVCYSGSLVGTRVENRSSTRRSKDETKNSLPHRFRCPLTLQCMEDPVTTTNDDGISFERSAILSWLTENKFCPVTGKILSKTDLISDTKLQAAIDEWFLEASQPPSSSLPHPNKPLLFDSSARKVGAHRQEYEIQRMYSDEKVDSFKRRFSRENVILALDEAIRCSTSSST